MTTSKISVVVSGTGFMGHEVLQAVARQPDMEPVGVIEKFAREEFVSLPGGDGLIPLGSDPVPVLARAKPQVLIDFTNAEWTPTVARAALERGVPLVIGTTGLSDAFLKELEAECKKRGVGAVVAPNFAIGAVLLIHLAKIASRHFDLAEISEMHQEKKLDAPSGTAVTTAKEMVEARGRPFEHTTPERETLAGSRGADYQGISIHSQRLPGFVAHQEVKFGGLGQTLTLRHDSIGRDSFIPGILLAAREAIKRKELIFGLDHLIDL